MSAPTTAVLDAIGLDAATQPLIEWQTPTVDDTPPAPSLTLVGVNQQVGSVSGLDLPAGTEPGDLFVVGLSAGAFYAPAVSCDDPRVTGTTGTNSEVSEFVGYGYADDDLTPVACEAHAGAGDVSGTVAVYRTNGHVGDVVVTSSGFPNSAITTPCVPDMPVAGAGHAGVMMVTAAAAHSLIDGNGAWTQDGASTYYPAAAASFYSLADLPAAHVITSLTSNEVAWWLALVVRVDAGTGDDTGGTTVWDADPDRSHSLVSYSLTYGRPDARPGSKVTPVQVTVRAAVALSPAPTLGDRFRIALTEDAATALGLTEPEAARFTGEVTDVQIDPDAGTWQAIAVGTGARKGRRAVDLTAAAPASAHARVSQILDAIGALTDQGTIDPADVLLATPSAPATGATLLDAVADSTLGQTVQQLDGRIDWHSPDHRRGAVPLITLDASEILSAITWAQHVGSVINDVTVNYAGGTVRVTDPASIEEDEPYPITVSTVLADAGAAVSLGALICGRFARPAWDLPVLTVDVARTVDPAHLAALLRLRHGHRLTITGLPVTGPITGTQDFYLEGFGETATATTWRMGLQVTDPAVSGVSVRWVDVDPGLSWDEVDPDLRWIDLGRIEDPDELGDPGTTGLDGGDSTTSVYDTTLDGGDSTTAAYDTTNDGGDST